MTKLDHIGIAVEDIEAAAQLYVAGLGLELEHVQTVEAQGVKVGFLPLGDTELEFLEPLNESSPIARSLAKRGAGLHHICIEVPDIREAMDNLRTEGARLLNEEPVAGAGGCLVCFVHPKSANGVLLELSQKPR